MTGLARRVLYTVRTDRDPAQRVLLLLLAGFSAVQVAMTWICLPVAMAARALAAPANPQLLIVAMGGIGDDVLSVPLIQALHRKYPGSRITLVVHSVAQGFGRLLPEEIGREICFRPARNPVLHLFDPLRVLALVLHYRLYAGTMLTVVARWDTDTGCAGCLALFSRAPRRLGFRSAVSAEKRARNWLYDSFYTGLSGGAPEMHESAKLALLLAEQEGVRPPALAGIWSGPTARAGMVVAPFAGKPRNHWPLENWAKAIRAIGQRHPEMVFYVVGGPMDRSQGALLAEQCPRTTSLCGATSFPQLLDILRGAKVYAGSDTGITHLAATSGVPIVVLFCHPVGASPAHYAAPERFRPVSETTIVLRPAPNRGCEAACESAGPCCVLNIDVSQVVEAVVRYI